MYIFKASFSPERHWLDGWDQQVVAGGLYHLEVSNEWGTPGPLLFNIFINNLEEVKESTPNRFTDNSKVGWCKPDGTLKGRSAIQSDLGRLEK